MGTKEFAELEDVLYGEGHLDATVLSVIRDADGSPVQYTVELHEGYSSGDDKIRLAYPGELEKLPEEPQLEGCIMSPKDAGRGFFKVPDLSFDEYRDQDVVAVDDGAFFDGLDEMFGIVPGTDRLKDEPDEE